eukprot:Platyproteum_vivax@DN7207_c0_g1_i1.p1
MKVTVKVPATQSPILLSMWAAFCTGTLLSLSVFCLFGAHHAFSTVDYFMDGLDLFCPIILVAQFFCPIILVKEALKTNNEASLPKHMFVIQAVSNILAVDYGLKIKSSAVLIANLLGLLSQV